MSNSNEGIKDSCRKLGFVQVKPIANFNHAIPRGTIRFHGGLISVTLIVIGVADKGPYKDLRSVNPSKYPQVCSFELPGF
jgi:hypothetical protein